MRYSESGSFSAGVEYLQVFLSGVPESWQFTAVADSCLSAGTGESAPRPHGAVVPHGHGIISGTKVVTVTNGKGGQVSRNTYDVTASASTLIGSELSIYNDEFGRPREIAYLDGTRLLREYSCCGLASETDREGIVTAFTRDYAERVLTSTRAGITTENTYDLLGRVRLVKRYPASQPSAAITISQSDYDAAGRLVSTRDHGRETIFQETPQPAQRRTTRLTKLPFDAAWPVADRGEITEITWADGRAASRGGNATAPLGYDYSTATLAEAASLGYASGTRFRVIAEIKRDAAGAETAETITHYLDPLGRTIKTAFPDGASSYQVYNDLGQLVRQTDPDGVVVLFAYNARGRQETTALDLNGNGAIDFAGTDRNTKTAATVATKVDGGTYTVLRSTTQVWEADNGDTPVTVSISEQSANAIRSWQTVRGLTTSSVTTLDGTGGRTITTTTPDGVKTVQVYSGGRLVSNTVKTAGDVQLAAATYAYDPHGRGAKKGASPWGLGLTRWFG